MTKQMTFAALSWLRYEKNCDIVCTEVGNHYLKDVFGLWIGEDGLPASSIEIEIKNSISDLRADFVSKATKHEWYLIGRNAPTYMYYVVPVSIVEKAKEIIREKNTKYGLMSFNAEEYLESSGHPFHIGKTLSSELRVSKLTNERPKPSLMYQCGRRIMNEYFLQKHLIENHLSDVSGSIDFYAKEITKKQRGRIDKFSPLNETQLYLAEGN